MHTLPRYTKNLHIDGNKVYSYTTHVATMRGDKLIVHGWWSVTTSKHVNYVADMYGLEKVEGPRDEDEREEDPSAGLRSVAMVAALGDVFGNTQEEANDWKARMLKAGLEGRGLIMPEDWGQLSEDEKERRLNGAIAELARP